MFFFPINILLSLPDPWSSYHVRGGQQIIVPFFVVDISREIFFFNFDFFK